MGNGGRGKGDLSSMGGDVNSGDVNSGDVNPISDNREIIYNTKHKTNQIHI